MKNDLQFALCVDKCTKRKEEMGKKLAVELAERGTGDMNDYVKKIIIAKKSIAPIITESIQTKQPGIYLFERTDENGVTFFYCGQAKNIFQRIVSHWNGYQHIDISMRKRKFKSDENPHGWAFCILEYCPVDKLDEREQYWILKQMRQGKQTYNVTYGSQTDGKQNIKEGKTPRGYYDGLEQGYKNAQKMIAHLFDKHLVVSTKKDPPTVNQQKALDKFMNFINLEEKGDENK